MAQPASAVGAVGPDHKGFSFVKPKQAEFQVEGTEKPLMAHRLESYHFKFRLQNYPSSPGMDNTFTKTRTGGKETSWRR